MRRIILGAMSLLVCLAIVGAGTPATKTTPASAAKHYVCSPCGMDCDKLVFDHPGTCPKCGQPLVEQGAAAEPLAKKVALLVFDRVEPIDYTGPFEVFGAAGYDVYTVGATKDPVTTVFGMKVVPKFTFADAPKPDVLLVPGGGIKSAMDSAPTIAWIQKTSGDAEITMSVCNGAFILGKAGLLDGLRATTTAHHITELSTTYPTVKPVYDQRYVDNGKIVTCGGLTSGMDGALHVISRLSGKGTAQQVALGEEYDWREGNGFARASLADMLIPDIDLSNMGDWDIASTQGDTDRWEIAVRGKSKLGTQEIMDRIGSELQSKGGWKNVAGKTGSLPGISSSQWAFQDRDGGAWQATLTVQPRPGVDHQYTSTLTLAKEHPKAG